MVRPRKLLFVLMDGGRARFVETSSKTGDFVTREELDHTSDLRRVRDVHREHSPGTVFESHSPARSQAKSSEYLRQAKEGFVATVVGRAAEIVRQEGLAGVFVVAPSRLIGALSDQLSKHTTVTGHLGKDLTKTPDHELGAWLSTPSFELGGAPSREKNSIT